MNVISGLGYTGAVLSCLKVLRQENCNPKEGSPAKQGAEIQAPVFCICKAPCRQAIRHFFLEVYPGPTKPQIIKAAETKKNTKAGLMQVPRVFTVDA